MPEESTPLEERFWTLVSLKLSGEATQHELAEFDELLRSHPDWGARLQLFANIWNSGRPNEAAAGQYRKEAFNRHLQRLSNSLASPALQYEQAQPAEQLATQPVTAEHTPTEPQPAPMASRRRFIRRSLAIAAAISAVAISIWLYRANSTKTPNGEYNTVSTRPGSRSKIQLPDGTVVWLNADSRLTYTVNNRTREIQLTGEAYFDVAKDKDRPFLIHTPTVDIRVLGTSFNVQSYSNEKNTETSLFQGSVEVALHNNPDRKIILQPNEKLIVHNNEMAVADIKNTRQKAADDTDEPLMTLGKVHFQQKDSSCMEALWTKNQLAFDNGTLEEVALQIERWYGVQVTITDPRMKNIRYSGVFEDESLEQVLEALKLSGDFHYTIHKKEVVIAP